MVDKDIIQRKLLFIDQKLHNLETLKLMKRQDFLTGFQAVDAAKYNLQVCIEAFIDVANINVLDIRRNSYFAEQLVPPSGKIDTI